MFEIISILENEVKAELQVGSLTLALQFAQSFPTWEIRNVKTREIWIRKPWKDMNPMFDGKLIKQTLLQEWFQISKAYLQDRITIDELRRKHKIIERYLLMC
jgi:hypothetical protein